ncbi:MAG: bacillithiol biosynthesis deacetylase BshB1 [Candidatus Hodarchaeota archaeon]
MTSQKLDILVVGAHPDDAEIGCGGTIAHYKKMGKRVGILDCSNGEPTPHGSPEIRAEEAKKAAQILNLDVRITLDMKNRYIENTIENRVKISEVFREYQPKIIITHPRNDWHPDHVAVHQLVNAAKFHAKLSKTDSKFPEYYPPRILYFDHSHIKEPRMHDFLVDISDSIDDKIEALKAYESQFIINKKNLKIFDYIKERAGYLGYQVGVRYAEGYTCPEYYLVKDITEII